METAMARAHVTRLLEINDEAVRLLPRLWQLQEEARELAAALLPPNLLAADAARYPAASAPPTGAPSVCDPATRAGLTRALLGLARAEPIGAQFLAQLQRTGCVLECGTNGCYRFSESSPERGSWRI